MTNIIKISTLEKIAINILPIIGTAFSSLSEKPNRNQLKRRLAVYNRSYRQLIESVEENNGEIPANLRERYESTWCGSAMIIAYKLRRMKNDI